MVQWHINVKTTRQWQQKRASLRVIVSMYEYSREACTNRVHLNFLSFGECLQVDTSKRQRTHGNPERVSSHNRFSCTALLRFCGRDYKCPRIRLSVCQAMCDFRSTFFYLHVYILLCIEVFI